MNTFWALIGKHADSKPIQQIIKEGTSGICFQFDDPDGPVVVTFCWSARHEQGMSSSVPCINIDDPDRVICKRISLLKVVNYDLSGHEDKLIITGELERAFINMVLDEELLYVDDYDLK